MKRHSPKEHMAYMQTLHKRVASVGLLLENTAGELLIVKAYYKHHWTIPGGVIDEGETPLQAAVRETQEEIGVQIDSKTVEFVAVVNRTGPVFDTYQFVFKAPLPEDAVINLGQDEIDEYVFVSRQEVASKNRNYGEVIFHWASGRSGYIEQEFEHQPE